MCKIMMIPGSKDSTNLNKFMRAAFPHLTAGDNDAFGYAAVSPTTGLFGERWTEMQDVFQSTSPGTSQDKALIDMLGDSIVSKPTGGYSSFGNKASDSHTVMLHARFATSGGGIENAHPFVSEQTALIHNGVIQNANVLNLNKQSTCDSEAVLELYKKHDVRRDLTEIQSVADELSGWYACGVLTKKADRWVMDIFRDQQASLFVTWVSELQTMVFCTTEEIIRLTCIDAGMTHGTIFKVSNESITRIDCLTGMVMDKTLFVSELYYAKKYEFPFKENYESALDRDLHELDRVIGDGEMSEQVDDVWEYMTNREKSKVIKLNQRNARKARGK